MLHRDSLPAFYDAVVKACFGRGMLQEEHRTVRVRARATSTRAKRQKPRQRRGLIRA